jgi:glycosyltransferase involved in cell wall biosynthesis
MQVLPQRIDTGIAPATIMQLRVCIVTEIFHPEDRGGMGRQAHALAECLIRTGIQVDAVTRKILPQSPSREQVGLVDVTRLPPAGVLKGRGWAALLPVGWFSFRLLLWLLRRANSYDVLLVQGSKTMLIPVFLASLVSRSGLVIKIDAFTDIGEEVGADSLAKMGLSPRSLPVRVWSRLRNSLLRRADGVIAISQEIHAALLARGVRPERIHSIPNGVDFGRFRPLPADARRELRARLELPLDRIIVIFTGRLSRGKGLPMLADVWGSLCQERADIHLLIVGSGRDSYDDCEPELRAFCTGRHLEHCMQFTGQVDDVTAYLQAADIFVLPSEAEGFSLALIEAMGAGMPCIVTRVGVAGEVVRDGENGMLIPIGDAAALAEALRWMLQHPDRWEQMGSLARQSVLDFCAMDSVVRRYVELFRSQASPV